MAEGSSSAKKLTRRAFLRIVAGIGMAGFAGKLGLDALEAASVVRRTRLLMGTIANLTLVAPRGEAGRAEAAVDDCLDCMEALEGALSRFQPESQVSRLNRTGRLPDPHPALLDLVRQARQVSELSEGLFDITILPVLALYQEQAGRLPEPEAIEAACRKVDYRRLQEVDGGLAFEERGMGITLDGIAKGYILDAGAARLAAHGFTEILIEAGGDLVAGGKGGHEAWKIGVQAPRAGGERWIARLGAANEAVATSGDYMQPFTPDFAQHHILNPHSGHSPPALASATVIAPHLALADALATTLMLMEPQAGLALVERLGLRALLVDKDLRVMRNEYG